MSGGAVLVTGCTGFIGGHLCRALVGDGVEVRGTTRGGGGVPAGVRAVRLEAYEGGGPLDRALEGVDTVVHLAARVHVMDERAADPVPEFRRANVDATAALLAASARAGVRRFVFASSVKVMGELSPGVWTERDEPRPADPYGVSKLEAERLVAAASGEGGMRTSVLRLPLVYGPGVRANMLSLLRLVRRGVPIPLGAVRNRRSLAYVGNVVAAVRGVAGAPDGVGDGTFFVSDGEDLSTPELVRRIGRALGRPARLVPVPVAAMRAAGRVGDLLRPVARFSLGSAAIERLTGSLAIDSSRLWGRIGPPPHTVDEGLRATAQWFLNAPTSGG